MNKKPKTSKTSPLDAPLYDADSIERMTFHCGSGWIDKNLPNRTFDRVTAVSNRSASDTPLPRHSPGNDAPNS